MEAKDIKINYLYNSAFKAETDKHILIFDYYLDSVESGVKNSSNGAIYEGELITDKEVLVFCTHSHADHYSDVILGWSEINPNIKYILSSEIEVCFEGASIYKISAYDEFKLQDVYVKAYSSTDIGISVLVKVDNTVIFHAGDLNWWNWYDESQEYNANQEIMYKNEIEKIKKEKVDVAFFPVDSRLKDSYALGAEYFIKEVKPKVLIPMHFREDYFITKEFKNKNAHLKTIIYEITKRGEEIRIINIDKDLCK